MIKLLIFTFNYSDNQVNTLQRKIKDLESEIESLQDDLILSHRAYEQCKKELEETDSMKDQIETSTLNVEVKGRRQETATYDDINVQPQVTTLDINVSPRQSLDYTLTRQSSTAEFEIHSQRLQTTVEYIAQQTKATTENEASRQTTSTLDIDIQQRHATTELEIDIDPIPRRIPATSWTTGSTSSFQVYRERKYEPVQFTLEEEDDGEYEIAQIESRSSKRWKY